MVKIVELPSFTDSGFQKLMVAEGEFDGVVFSYRDVALTEVDGNCVLSFTYVLHSGSVNKLLESKFKNILGDYLYKKIDEQLLHNDVIYANGVEE